MSIEKPGLSPEEMGLGPEEKMSAKEKELVQAGKQCFVDLLQLAKDTDSEFDPQKKWKKQIAMQDLRKEAKINRDFNPGGNSNMQLSIWHPENTKMTHEFLVIFENGTVSYSGTKNKARGGAFDVEKVTGRHNFIMPDTRATLNAPGMEFSQKTHKPELAVKQAVEKVESIKKMLQG